MAVYISQDLLLSGALNDGYINADNPRIGYHNLVNFAGVTADSENSSYPATNTANPASNLWWESLVDTTQYINFTLGVSTWNYFGIAGHNLSGATYQMQWRADPGDAWSDATLEYSPADNSAIMHLFENIIAPYARLKITPASGVLPKVAVVYIGEYLTLPARVYVGHSPINYARNTTFSTGGSEYGDYLGRVKKRQKLTNSLEQDDVDKTFYRTDIEPFAKNAELSPFFVAWRPGEFPLEVGYCWTTKDIVPENSKSNGAVKFTINMNGLAPWPEEV